MDLRFEIGESGIRFADALEKLDVSRVVNHRLAAIDRRIAGQSNANALSHCGVAAKFEELGGLDSAQSDGAPHPHPLMHRGQTLDYGIVLEGELTLVLDRDETTVRAGDIVIQRGTNHACANRSGSNGRIAFLLIDGRFAEGL